jgi:hypothetical protein
MPAAVKFVEDCRANISSEHLWTDAPTDHDRRDRLTYLKAETMMTRSILISAVFTAVMLPLVALVENAPGVTSA